MRISLSPDIAKLTTVRCMLLATIFLSEMFVAPSGRP